MITLIITLLYQVDVPTLQRLTKLLKLIQIPSETKSSSSSSSSKGKKKKTPATITAQDVSLFENREFLLELLVSHHERKRSQKQETKALPLYPTEAILWDENMVCITTLLTLLTLN